MNKQDSKYFNTASYMDEALLVLLEKKDYDFITVKEVCQTAGVNRSTFYLHYEKMDDLLEETVSYVNNKFMDKLSLIGEVQDPTKVILTTDKYLRPYLSFIKENKKIYRLMHEKPYLFHIDKITNRLYKDIFDIALTNFKVKEEEKKYIFSFYTEGVIGIIKRWLEEDCNDEIDFIIGIIERNTFSNEKNHK